MHSAFSSLDNPEGWQPPKVPISRRYLQGRMWMEQFYLFYCSVVMISPNCWYFCPCYIFSESYIFKHFKVWGPKGSLVGIKSGWPHFNYRRGDGSRGSKYPVLICPMSQLAWLSEKAACVCAELGNRTSVAQPFALEYLQFQSGNLRDSY